MSPIPGFGSSVRTGYLLTLSSAASAGLATVIGKWNLNEISPLLMNTLIFSVATVALSMTLIPTQGVKKVFCHSGKGWLWILLFAATSWAAVWAFWAGVQRMDPSLASFLNRTEVFVAILLAVIILRERFTRTELVGASLSLLGIIIMRMTMRFEYTDGFWLVLLGALFFGITEFTSKIAVRYVEPTSLAYIRNMLLALFFWISLFISGINFEGLDIVWPGVIALGIIGPILSRLVYLMALQRIDLSKAAIIGQSQPIFVMLIALPLFGQLPTARELAGGVLLTLGCVAMVTARRTIRSR